MTTENHKHLSVVQPKVGQVLQRNLGTALELDWVRAIRVNRSAVERRANTLTKRRSIKKEWQTAWLLRAVTLIDLTTLSGDDTPGKVERLCAKAIKPVSDQTLNELGFIDRQITVGAVCVYHSMLPAALRSLSGTGIPVAAVSAGFPTGLASLDTRIR